MGDEREERISVGEEARAGDEIGRFSRVGEVAAVGDARYLKILRKTFGAQTGNWRLFT